MSVFAVRGATTVAANTKREIVEKTTELFEAMRAANIADTDVKPVYLLISSTEDVTAFYPAQAVRESGQTDLPLFSAQEPKIEGGLPLCIRMLLLLSCGDENGKGCKPKHVYLHGAAALRPDLKNQRSENK